MTAGMTVKRMIGPTTNGARMRAGEKTKIGERKERPKKRRLLG
jgi:hypothetical protein